MSVSLMPSARYSCEGSPERFWNGRTATERIGAAHGSTRLRAGAVVKRRAQEVGRAQSHLGQGFVHRLERDLWGDQKRHLIEGLIDAGNVCPGAQLAAAIELEHQLDLGARR